MGRAPVCLLDDMLSELDPARRGALRPLLQGGGQCLITATSQADWDAFGVAAPEALFRVDGGRLSAETPA